MFVTRLRVASLTPTCLLAHVPYAGTATQLVVVLGWELATPGNEADLGHSLQQQHDETISWKHSTTGSTLLHYACSSSPPSIKATMMLVKAGADVNSPNNALQTALYVCAAAGTDAHQLICIYLLDHGADPAIKSSAGDTPLDIAKAEGRQAIVGLLEKRAQVVTPCHASVSSSHACARALIHPKSFSVTHACTPPLLTWSLHVPSADHTRRLSHRRHDLRTHCTIEREEWQLQTGHQGHRYWAVKRRPSQKARGRIRRVRGQDKNIAEKVALYLSSGIPVIDFMEGTYDPFDENVVISGGSSLLSDGYWIWRYDLAYLVEKYCLGLPEKFIKHVLESSVVDQSVEAEVLKKTEIIYREYERIRQSKT